MNLDELKSLAKQLPEHQPDAERSDVLRKSLLNAVERESPRRDRRRLWIPLAAVAAAALAFYAGTRMPDNSNPATLALTSPAEVAFPPGPGLSFASLASDDGAAFTRHVNPDTRTEEIRLSNGGLRVDSDTSRQLVVHTRFAELRGDAAVFKVQATDNRLRSVVVLSGRVELHIKNQPAVILGPGQEWNDAQIIERIELALRAEPGVSPESLPNVTKLASESTPLVDKTERREESPRIPTKTKSRTDKEQKSPPSKTPIDRNNTTPEVVPEDPNEKTEDANAKTEDANAKTEDANAKTEDGTDDIDPPDNSSAPAPKASPAELAFASGYRALKESNYIQAIADFNTAIKTGQDNAMRGDSRYWRSIAMAKSGQNVRAIASMSEFLKHHNASPRAGEVATMLGWLYLEGGKFERASALFERGQNDTSAKVRNSAKAGLQAIAQ